MEVIPVINCPDFDCVKKRFDVIRELGSKWVEIDVSDGKFASGATWNNLNELSSNLKSQISNLRFAVHLMVMEPENYVSDWLKVGAKRIIVHVESSFNFERMKKMCDEGGAELMISLKPDTPIKKVEPFLDGGANSVQFLAVNPGPSGQNFQEQILAKIRLLREKLSDVKIEVDGGINPETAKLVKEAGADIVVSGSYIFDASSPTEAYKKLVSISNE